MLKDGPHVAIFLTIEAQYCDGDTESHPTTHTGVGVDLRVAVVPPDDGAPRPYWPPSDEATERAVLAHIMDVVSHASAGLLRALDGADEPQVKVTTDYVPVEVHRAPLVN